MTVPTLNPRILLIEDGMLVAGMLRGMLSRMGYAVTGTTADFAEAMGMLDRDVIDAVVLDINLNGQMSYPIADKLVARGIPFIFSTAYEPQCMPAEYREFPVLRKPFRRSALGVALALLLRQGQEPAGLDVYPIFAQTTSEPEHFRKERTG